MEEGRGEEREERMCRTDALRGPGSAVA